LAAAVRPGGKVIALDLDPEAIERCQQIIAEHSVEAFCANYCDLGEVASEGVDAILLDLGLSSDQLADAERGFSFSVAGRLDLRFDRTQGESASELLARIDERSLADLIYRYGEERFSRRIAKKIVATRREHPFHRAEQLADLVRSCVPRSRGHRIDPATRTFQALRIAVNGELESLESALKRLPECLIPGGRLAIISFHSLEDRLVKHAFREDERLNVLTKKPLQASESEIAKNPRSRSAKLRVAERR
jgi:16S rRNA (cytosine1402-N4)-methyltransferase